MTATETKLVRLGDLGTEHVWFSGVGQPTGCDLRADDGEPLELPHEHWWELQGTIDGNKWTWNGEGNPTDWKGNTVYRIVAFLPAGEVAGRSSRGRDSRFSPNARTAPLSGLSPSAAMSARTSAFCLLPSDRRRPWRRNPDGRRLKPARD